MKKKIIVIVSYTAILGFFLYWLFFFLLSFPSNKLSDFIKNKSTRFRSIYVTKWTLFTPPATNNYRLYYISQNIAHPGDSDTIEVMEKISIDKQRNAPSNQHENIVDLLIFKNMVQIIKTVYLNDKYIENKKNGIINSSFNDSVKEQVKKDKNLLLNLNNLGRYGLIALKEKNIDTTNRRVSLLIKEKPIRPFKEMKNSKFELKENMIFEVTFYPIVL